jgi:hypothetical protein
MDVSFNKTLRMAAWVLLLGLSATLSACLTSQDPKLSVEDLRQPEDFRGRYIASSFPGDDKAAEATVVPGLDRSYTMQITEGDHKDSPVHLRFLDLSSGQLLAVMTEDATPDTAMYALVTRASDGALVFRSVALKPEVRGRSLKEVLFRHGATAVVFEAGDAPHDEIKGALTAANLRALFTDPEFLAAVDSGALFRLSRAE